MLDTPGPVSFLGTDGAMLGLLSPSRGKVDAAAANLLPVFLSLTSPGLKPNRPPLGAGWGLGAGFSCRVARGRVVALWVPPIGGGGGGGGGAPAKQGNVQMTAFGGSGIEILTSWSGWRGWCTRSRRGRWGAWGGRPGGWRRGWSTSHDGRRRGRSSSHDGRGRGWSSGHHRRRGWGWVSSNWRRWRWTRSHGYTIMNTGTRNMCSSRAHNNSLTPSSIIILSIHNAKHN